MKKADLTKTYASIVSVKSKSVSTRSAYTTCFHQWIDHIGQPGRATANEIRNYLADLSDSKYNQMLASMSIIYRQVLNQPLKLKGIKYRETSPKLWSVLSEAEVRTMISTTYNIKHRLIIILLYTLGLRRAELLNLQLRDINRGTMQIRVHRGKGAKDRLIDIGYKLLHIIEVYWRQYRPDTYVIEGQSGGRYSASSVASILKAHNKRTKKNITPHLLRHSIATHLINQNINLLALQRFLGHKKPETTEYYFHYVKSGTITLAQRSLLEAA